MCVPMFYLCTCVSIYIYRYIYIKYIISKYIPALSPPTMPFEAAPPEQFTLRPVEVFGAFDAGSVCTMAVTSFLAALKLNIPRREEGS